MILNFLKNRANWGGAIYSGYAKSSFTITNTKFIKNEADSSIGALGVFKNAILNDVTFTSNTVLSTDNPDGSGAVFFGAQANAKVDGGLFEYNESITNAGAIGTRRAAEASNINAKLDITNSTFVGNKTGGKGGSINNYFYNDSENRGSVYVGNSVFEANEADLGGAIYNHGEIDQAGNRASITIDSNTFSGNTATEGGALYNDGTMVVSDSIFDSNAAKHGGAISVSTTGDLTVNRSTFTNNTALAAVTTTGWGGAIDISGAGKAVITDSEFSENKAKYAGAIATSKDGSSLTVSNTKFINNEAEEIGAMVVFNSANLTNVTFTSNTATSTNDYNEQAGSGAIFLGSQAKAQITGGLFEYNESGTNGGAIGTRKYDTGNNVNATLDITDSRFVGNKAGEKGGAIDNYFFNSNTQEGAVYIGNTIFEANEAKLGGAIYNHDKDKKAVQESVIKIDSSTFSGNKATKGGAIYNAGEMTISSNTLFISNEASDCGGAIYNEGNLNIEDGVQFILNYAKNEGGAIYNAANSTVTFNGSATFANNMVAGALNDIYSDGELFFSSGTTTMQGGIVGVGTTTINGAKVNLENNATLEQYNLNILENSELSVNAEKLVIDNADITNNGLLNFFAGTKTLTNNIVGVGTTTINNANITVDSTTITQYGLNISSVSTLTSDASSLIISSEIVNDGMLKFTGGNNDNIIKGDGTLNIAGNVVNNADKKISQKKIEITEGHSFETNAGDIITTDGILNNGQLTFTDGVNISTITALYNKGELFIAAGGNVENTALIKQSTITIADTSTLSSDINNIRAMEQIVNDGTLVLTGTGINNNTIGHSGENLGNLLIGGNIINALGTKIDQNSIEVTTNSSFKTNADDITTMVGIINDGDLTFTGGTNKNAVNKGNSEYGKVFVTGDLKNEAQIEQYKIDISTDAKLTSDVDNLIISSEIVNYGRLKFIEEGTNNNIIKGDGILEIAGKIKNVQDKIIEQKKIEILEKDSEFTAVASDLTTTDGILNNGTLIFNSGDLNDDENKNDIDGTGELIIKDNDSGNYLWLVNSGTIKQSTITIAAGSILESNVNNIKATEKIQNNGGLTLTGEGENTNIIDGTGDLEIAGKIENLLGTKINQNSITVAGNTDSFKAYASDITTDSGIFNFGDLIFTGGVNTSTITGPGDLQVTGDLINTAAIEQNAIDVESNIFENVRGSSITANTLTANTTFMTDAGDLDIGSIILSSDSARLLLLDDDNADLGANISGAGSLIKEGTGIVTLNGDNQYAGTTTISNGALRISSATNISDGEGKIIYMNGGTLMVAEDLALDSKIVGTFVEGVGVNDVNILVESEKTATLTTNSKIHGEGDLVKTGEGTLDLQMESNNYLGNTRVLEGTLRGTTDNINGLLIGTGATSNTDIFEFYDDDTDVVLNEVDDTDYIGTFNKTGSSTMTVINNFQAVNANISSGTFVINNDYIMGGSGKNFTVDREMIVNNALLKGYGDITVGKLIIGNGATFAPGNSTTTFKVNGDLEFQAGSTYDVEISQLDMDKANEEQTNDKIVAGNTTIDPDSNIILNNTLGKYYVHETMTLIEAASMNEFEYNQEGSEVVTDQGDYKEITLGNVTLKDYDARALRAGYSTRISTRVYVDNGNLMLGLERKASEYGTTKEFTRSHNEQEAATAIDNISTGNAGDITLPLNVMEHFFYYEDPVTGKANIPALKGALNDVAGVIHANSTMLTFTNAKIEHVYDKIQKRSIDLLPCTKFHDKIWAQYYYNTYDVKANDNSPKFDTGVNGFLVGFDMISANNWTMGVTAGYGISELNQLNDKTVMKDINLGFYGGYETDSWLFKGMLLGGYEKYNTDRNIRFMNRMASSEYNGFSTTLDLEAGYKIALNSSTSTHKLTLKPFLGITGSYITQEGFEEKGAESLNLKVEGYDNIVAQARLGVGINGKINKFGWYANAGVRQFLTEDYNEIELSLLDYQAQTKMKIRSAELDKFSYGAGLGADYELSDAWTIFANGLASFADKSNNYYGNIGLTYKFGCINNETKTKEDLDRMSAMLDKKLKEEENSKKELEVSRAREKEKELQNKIQRYEVNIVSEERAKQLKEKTFKTMRLGEKPTFRFGSDELNGRGKESVRQLARELKQHYPDAQILIEGHTDSVGSDTINQKISENRASKVATTLKKEFNVQNDISVIGKGETEPIASNDTAEGRAQNRRVELIITTEK